MNHLRNRQTHCKHPNSMVVSYSFLAFPAIDSLRMGQTGVFPALHSHSSCQDSAIGMSAFYRQSLALRQSL